MIMGERYKMVTKGVQGSGSTATMAKLLPSINKPEFTKKILGDEQISYLPLWLTRWRLR